ncbi:MAG: PEGA domain-containing protein [Victivallales bacterium]
MGQIEDNQTFRSIKSEKKMMKTYLAPAISLGILLMTSCAPEKPRATKGQLELNSNPQGADILVDSTLKSKKQTPVILSLSPGTHLVKLSRDNYLPLWRYVKISAGRKVTLNLKLTPVRGAVLINSEPVGAKVVMDGKNQGITPLVITDLKPGEYSAQIEHLNRAPRMVKWTVNGVRPQKISVLLESDIGVLVLKTEPSRAKVYIDDKICGFTPYKTELQEGRHNVRVKLNGFAEAKSAVDIVRDKTTDKTIKLIRLPGSFEFRSSPEGAVVYINNRSYGKTPLTVPDLQSGKYKVRVEKSGFDSISRDAYITEGRTNVVEFTLKRNTGGIDLIINPPGVTVYLNGKKYSTTTEGESKNLSKVIHIRNLPAGTYYIMLAHKRMVPSTKKYKIVVKKAAITRPKPINLWVANSVLKVKDEPQIIALVYEENDKRVIYSPEPGVKITRKRSEIELVRPLTETDQ